MVSSSLILQHLHLILGWPPSSSMNLYDHRAPALSLSPWASLPDGECHWLWVWAHSGKRFTGWTQSDSLCLTFALFEAYKLLDWIFSYQHPLNPSSISWVFQQSHPDKHLTQIPWELSHPLSDSEVMGHTRQESQILVMAMREEALWEKEEGSSGCVHFVMVIVHTKLLVLQEKTLPINHPLGSILLPSACIFIQGSYSCSFMEWRKPHLTLGTSPSQKTRKPTQKAVGQTHWQLICIIFIVFSLWLFLILP